MNIISSVLGYYAPAYFVRIDGFICVASHVMKVEQKGCGNRKMCGTLSYALLHVRRRSHPLSRKKKGFPYMSKHRASFYSYESTKNTLYAGAKEQSIDEHDTSGEWYRVLGMNITLNKVRGCQISEATPSLPSLLMWWTTTR